MTASPASPHLCLLKQPLAMASAAITITGQGRLWAPKDVDVRLGRRGKHRREEPQCVHGTAAEILRDPARKAGPRVPWDWPAQHGSRRPRNDCTFYPHSTLLRVGVGATGLSWVFPHLL